MKKSTVLMALFLCLLVAGFATADPNIDIGIVNTDTVTSTGGNSVATNTQTQGQTNEQKQKMEQDAHSSASVSSPRNHTTAVPGYAGALMSVAPIMADGRWHSLICEEYTVEELKLMRSSSSYANREGFYLANLFSSPVERTLRVKRFKGEIKDSSVVRLVSNFRGNKIVAEYEGSGAKGVPMSAILAYAALEGVYDTGELSIVAEYRIRDIAQLSGVGIGSGAAAAVSSSDSSKSGSLSVGAIIGFSEAYSEYVYDIRIRVVRASAEALALAECYETVSVAIPEQPAPSTAILTTGCDPERLLAQLKEYAREIIWCKFPCWNNEKLRFGKGNTLMHLFYCTGNRQYLLDAMYEYGVAERDFNNGRELATGQKFGDVPKGVLTPTLPVASELMYKVAYNKSLTIRELNGEQAQIAHAQFYELGSHGTKDMPTEERDMKN